jgi:hypothetical protein
LLLNTLNMKKILLFLLLSIFTIEIYSQTPKSTLKTYFETGDTPTESQFGMLIDNTYNEVTDGIFNLTGYPSISLAPFTVRGIGTFYTNSWANFNNASYIPNDTTTIINFNGVGRFTRLYIGSTLVTNLGGDSYWTISGSRLRPLNLTDSVIIGTTTPEAKFTLLGNSHFTGRLTLSGSLGILTFDNASSQISETAGGDLNFYSPLADSITLTEIKNSLSIQPVFQTTTNRIFQTAPTDTLIIGSATAIASGYGLQIDKPTYIGDSVFVNSTFRSQISKSFYNIVTPRINFNDSNSDDAYIYQNTSTGLLYFKDRGSSTAYPLSNLVNQGVNNFVGSNGITSTTGTSSVTFRLGGALSQFTYINTGTQEFRIGNSSPTSFIINNSIIEANARNFQFNGTNGIWFYTSSLDNQINMNDIEMEISYNSDQILLGQSSFTIEAGIDRPFYLRSQGGVGRLYIEDISYTEYTPVDSVTYAPGRIYVDSDDTIPQIGRRGKFEPIGLGSGNGSGDHTLNGSLALNHVVKGYNATTVQTSTLEVVGDTTKPEILKIMNLKDETDTVALGILPGTDGEVVVFALVDTSASWALDMSIGTANEILANRVNGEIAWYYYDKERGIVKRYELGKTPSQINQQLMAANEINLKLIAKLEDRIDKLENRGLRKLFRKK